MRFISCRMGLHTIQVVIIRSDQLQFQVGRMLDTRLAPAAVRGDIFDANFFASMVTHSCIVPMDSSEIGEFNFANCLDPLPPQFCGPPYLNPLITNSFQILLSSQDVCFKCCPVNLRILDS